MKKFPSSGLAPPEIRFTEIHPGEIRVTEVCLVQLSALEPRPAETGFAEIRLSEIRTS